MSQFRFSSKKLIRNYLAPFQDKGVAGISHANSHIHNLGYTFYSLFANMNAPIEHIVL